MSTKRKRSGANARAALISAVRGEAGKTLYLGLWLPVLSAIWAACFLFAWCAYPGYQIANHDISDLGAPAMNPHGWRYWSIGMGIVAFMALPPIAYASRRMAELTSGQSDGGRRLVSLGAICLRGACLGLAGLALAPQGHTFDTMHVISGVFAMGGAYVTLLFFWGAPLFHVGEMSRARLAFFTVSAWWGVVGFLATQGYRFFAYGEVGHDYTHKGESLLLRFSLWEWMLFAAVTTSFALLVALLPPKIHGMEVAQ
jgi:hypothetical protein